MNLSCGASINTSNGALRRMVDMHDHGGRENYKFVMVDVHQN